jgi:hypothetical protein
VKQIYPSSAKIKNAWSYTSTPYIFMAWCIIKHRDITFSLLLLYYFYVIKKDEMCRTCSSFGWTRNACNILMGKFEGKRPLGDIGVEGRIILKQIFKK